MFGDEFDRVFNPNTITPELIVTAHRLFGEIETEKHRAMVTMRQSGLNAESAEHWLVEGAFHVLFCTGLLAKKAEVDLANFDECRELISNAMMIVGRYYARKDRVAAYRLFRSVKAGEELRQEIGAQVPPAAQFLVLRRRVGSENGASLEIRVVQVGDDQLLGPCRALGDDAPGQDIEILETLQDAGNGPWVIIRDDTQAP